MAQGATKKSSKPAPNIKRSTVSGVAKRGSRQIAPKKAVAVARRKILKKHTSGLINVTERQLGAKAGHLELLAGGKRKGKVEPEKGGKGGMKGKGK